MNIPQLTPGNPIRRLPVPAKRFLGRIYWMVYDLCDFVAELSGLVPSHWFRRAVYRHLLRVTIGAHTSVHRHCRMYQPQGICIGEHTVVNRNVLLDGRMGLVIGNNVSISEGVAIFSLEHDPNSPTFAIRGGCVSIADRVFVGSRAIILPGVQVGEGAVVAAGAVVTHNVPPYTIVGGVPAKPIGQRTQDLTYTLSYRKFLG